MRDFEHYIITLFNVDRGFDKTNRRNSLEYLQKRFDIFEMATIPSIASQGNQNFFWFVFFDSQTPDEFKQKIQNILNLPNCLPVYVQGEYEILPFLKKQLSSETRYLVTTNLDNDDAIHKNFVDMIQANLRDEQIYFLNFPFGYMLRKDGLLMREFLSSPFHTLVEPVSEELLTCLSVPHTFLFPLFLKGFPVYQIPSQPAWLQFVHDTNVVNNLDINAILVLDVNLISDFGIKGIPTYFKEFDRNKSSKFQFLCRLISNKKKSPKYKFKLFIYTLFPSLAPFLFKMNNLFEISKKQSYYYSSSELRNLLSKGDLN